MIYSGNNMSGARIFEASKKTTAVNTNYWHDLCYWVFLNAIFTRAIILQNTKRV
jgi:hypothetical protein